MSETLRVALVCEGTTDRIVINSAITSLLGPRDFSLTQLQPDARQIGTGWPGVYKWSRQAADQAGGSLRDNPLFDSFDVLVVHLDADVAGTTYGSANIIAPSMDLPCANPCPPPSDTTDALREVILGWLGEGAIPPKTVFCTPSKSTEAWVLAALFQTDPLVLQAFRVQSLNR